MNLFGNLLIHILILIEKLRREDFEGKLYFITLNYILCYTLYLKIFKCTFFTLDYGPCYTLPYNVKFAINLSGKYDITWKDLFAHLLNALKTKDKLYLTILNYTPYYTLHPNWIFIQVNNKFNGRVQSVIEIII